MSERGKKAEKNQYRYRSTMWAMAAVLLAAGMLLGGCQSTEAAEGTDEERAVIGDGRLENGTGEEAAGETEESQTGIAGETAKDAKIDFTVLKEENPDIFAWIQIPGTGIDAPVLQSEEADDFYESHNAYGEADETGAIYTELANLKNMCDFNTVINGKSEGEGTPFTELYQFANPDFFGEHEKLYVYLPDNILTYEIFAAYEREDTSLIRTYDFTYASGCEEFLGDLYGSKVMGKNVREGWEGVTPYHFLVTLTTRSSQSPDKQFVVVAALTGDAAGTINRVVEE